jgi:hypothetical protein
MGKSKKKTDPSSNTSKSEIKAFSSKKSKSNAKASKLAAKKEKKTKTKKTVKIKIEPGLQTETVEKPQAETFADGLRVGWKAVIKGETHPFHSVRDMTVGLRNKGFDVGSQAALRAFIRRRKKGIKINRKSVDKFRGVDSLTRVSDGFNLLEGVDTTVPEVEVESVDSSSSSSSESESENGSTCTVQ